MKEVSRVLDARWNLLVCAKQVFFVFALYIYSLERAKFFYFTVTTTRRKSLSFVALVD